MKATPQYYRNTAEIQGIEPGALWQRLGNHMILVDEDQYVKAAYAEDVFEKTS